MKRLFLLSLVSFGFFVANGQALQLLHPTSGDVWPAFTTQRIQWQFANLDNIKIEISIDSARTWTVLQSSYPASASYYVWTVTNRPSDSCFVRISDVADPTVQSSNYPNNPFQIPKPSLHIDDVAASVYGKTALPITWTSAGVQKIRLLASYGNLAIPTLIADNIPAAQGFYNYVVKDTIASNCQVIIQSADAYALADTLDEPFTIQRLPFPATAKYHGGSYDGHSSATNMGKAIRVLSPNKKELLNGNSIYPVSWSSISISRVNIQYSIDSGTTWKNIDTSISATLFTYNWTVPSTPSVNCLVKIADASDTSVYDVSDSVFTINANSLKLTGPSENEVAVRGQVVQLGWTSKGISNIDIAYRDGTAWKTISNGVNAPNEVFNWVVPANAGDSVTLKISDNSNPSLADSIAKLFIETSPVATAMKYRGGSYDGHSSATNKAPFLTLTNPNGHESIASSVPYHITWNSSSVTKVDLRLSVDSGHTWQSIVSSYTNTGSYAWGVPATPLSNCLVQVRSADDSTISDISDSVFTILAKSIDLILDTTATRYLGTALQLEWNQSGIDKVSLDYKTSHNGSWLPIKTGLAANIEVCNWALPGTKTDSVWIRISDDSDPSVKDEKLLAGVFKTLPVAAEMKYLGGSFDGHAFRSTNNKISIFKPAANDTLKSGSLYPISWIAGNVTDSVTLQYTLDSGVTWINIVNTAAVGGHYNWTVPSGPAARSSSFAAAQANSAILSSKCIVRAITSNGGNEIVGVSSNTFSIQQESSLPANYYWVGGSGLWSDYAHHWATTSGGMTFHSTPPSSSNNVFFDANSFNAAGQTVTVDGPAWCNNMNWTGVTNQPTLLVPALNKLNVYGSITTD